MMASHYQNEFNLEQNIYHLNHAAVGPWPTRTADAVKQFADENSRQGSKHYLQWIEKESALRDKLRRLINAPSVDDIALLKSTSEGLSVIAYGIRWKRGDNVVIPAQEFPSNKIVWESLKQFGVSTQAVDLAATSTPEHALIERCDKNTRLISVSAVQYANGFKLDLKQIGEYCTQNNILFCVDAIQTLGAQPLDTQEIAADFIVADGHKWMLGAEGLALFYSRPDARDKLHLNQYGWHMVEKLGDFDNPHWDIADTARRFESGSPNMLGIIALNASLSLIEEIGISQIEQSINRLTTHLTENIELLKELQVLSDMSTNRRSGIVLIKHQSIDSNKLYQSLSQNGVMCAVRGGGIRLSPHFYNTTKQLDHVLDLILHLSNR